MLHAATFIAMNHLKVRSCLIDGEVVAYDGDGLAVFDGGSEVML